MGALAKLFSCSAAFFLKQLLPELLRLIILAICILWKHCKHLSSSHKYTSMINKKSSKFAYRRRATPNLVEYCSICLSEFAEGDEARELVDCRHVFHSHCLEKWLQGYRQPTCPLCRRLVVPEVIVEEYHQMQIDQENDGIEKELALILLKALHGGSCHGFF